jgi:hypothetical protein
MARWEAPDSATSSFLLTEAPHLDGKYTIFGHVESGGATVNKILRVPRDGTTPRERLTVLRARVIDNLAQYYAQHPRDPFDAVEHMATLAQDRRQTGITPITGSSEPVTWLPYLALAIVVLGVTGCIFPEHLAKKHLRSLLMLNVLIGGFGLLILCIPLGHRTTWLAPVLFLGLFGLFKLMSRFENN